MRNFLAISALALTVALSGCGSEDNSSSEGNQSKNSNAQQNKEKSAPKASFKLGKRVDNVAFVALFDKDGYEAVGSNEYIYLAPRAARAACGTDTVVAIEPIITGASSYFAGVNVTCAPGSSR